MKTQNHGRVEKGEEQKLFSEEMSLSLPSTNSSIFLPSSPLYWSLFTLACHCVNLEHWVSHNPSTGGNGMSNYTWTLLRASQNLAADPVAVPITTLTPVHCLPVPLGPAMPPPSQNCATISTMAIPCPHPTPLKSTNATSQDAPQPTLGRSTTNSPATERTPLSLLQALAVPSKATPEYLS